MPRLNSIVLAVVGTLFSASLLAAASSAQLDNFRFQLTDLDLSDGVAPSLTFMDGSLSGSTSYVSGALTAFQDASPSMFGPTSTSFTSATASASASVTGGNLPHLVVQAGGTAIDNANSANYVASAGTGDFNQNFMMSPHTSVTFTADLTGATSPTLATSDVFSSSYVDAWMWARTGYFSTSQPGDEVIVDLYDGLSAQGRTMSVTIANDGSSTSSAFFHYSLWVSGTSLPAAVPEPGPISLLIGGLAIVLLLVGRRGQPGFV